MIQDDPRFVATMGLYRGVRLVSHADGFAILASLVGNHIFLLIAFTSTQF